MAFFKVYQRQRVFNIPEKGGYLFKKLLFFIIDFQLSRRGHFFLEYIDEDRQVCKQNEGLSRIEVIFFLKITDYSWEGNSLGSFR